MLYDVAILLRWCEVCTVQSVCFPEEKKWKKMYFQEKKLTQTNEDRLRRLRNEVYRRMGTMATINQQDTTLKGT